MNADQTEKLFLIEDYETFKIAFIQHHLALNDFDVLKTAAKIGIGKSTIYRLISMGKLNQEFYKVNINGQTVIQSPKNLLDTYNENLQAIYDYFGFKEDWAVYPIEDRRDYYWEMNAVDVTYYDSLEAYENKDGMHTYSDQILYHRFYPKAVFEGAEYTLVMVDTHTDGNRFLAIYDNAKKVV